MNMNANDYVGIPFQDLGRTRAGADCWGLVRLVFADHAGLDLPDLSLHYDSATDRQNIELLYTALTEADPDWKRVDHPEPGDVIVLKIQGTNLHFGIVLEQDQFLHTMRGRESTIEFFTSYFWCNRVMCFYRHQRAKWQQAAGQDIT